MIMLIYRWKSTLALFVYDYEAVKMRRSQDNPEN